MKLSPHTVLLKQPQTIIYVIGRVNPLADVSVCILFHYFLQTPLTQLCHLNNQLCTYLCGYTVVYCITVKYKERLQTFLISLSHQKLSACRRHNEDVKFADFSFLFMWCGYSLIKLHMYTYVLQIVEMTAIKGSLDENPAPITNTVVQIDSGTLNSTQTPRSNRIILLLTNRSQKAKD